MSDNNDYRKEELKKIKEKFNINTELTENAVEKSDKTVFEKIIDFIWKILKKIFSWLSKLFKKGNKNSDDNKSDKKGDSGDSGGGKDEEEEKKKKKKKRKDEKYVSLEERKGKKKLVTKEVEGGLPTEAQRKILDYEKKISDIMEKLENTKDIKEAAALLKEAHKTMQELKEFMKENGVDLSKLDKKSFVATTEAKIQEVNELLKGLSGIDTLEKKEYDKVKIKEEDQLLKKDDKELDKKEEKPKEELKQKEEKSKEELKEKEKEHDKKEEKNNDRQETKQNLNEQNISTTQETNKTQEQNMQQNQSPNIDKSKDDDIPKTLEEAKKLAEKVELETEKYRQKTTALERAFGKSKENDPEYQKLQSNRKKLEKFAETVKNDTGATRKDTLKQLGMSDTAIKGVRKQGGRNR